MPVVGEAQSTTDILTAAEAYAALNVTASDQAGVADEVAQVITAASSFCDSVYGPVVIRSITETVDGAATRIWLTTPVASVTSVTEYVGGVATELTAEQLTSSTSSNYYLDTRLGSIARRASWTNRYFGRQRVVVAYSAGRYANTAACAPWAKEACAEALIHFWQARGANSGAANFGGDGAPFGGVPFSTAQLRKKLQAMYPEQALVPALA